MKILHLAYEDHAQPGSGGGSLRTHEINRRLAAKGHDITVVAAGYPGAQDRTEDGVKYMHVGGGKTRARAFSYFARLPKIVRGSDADLIVEDFGAPISTIGTPRFTDTPVVAMVQWMFAKEMAAKFRLPFHLVENWGIKAHRRFIAVSADLADAIRARRLGAHVDVVGNGVDQAAFAAVGDPGRFSHPGAPLVFLGRLDNEQKGLDVLIEALAHIPGRRLLIAGDGPDETRLRRLADTLGVTARISWLGRVGGDAKYRLLATAALAVIPSRWETFGIVAIEALAAGTPVVGSDIDCLRDVIPDGAGWRVPPSNPTALAAAVNQALDDPARLVRHSAAGRAFARRFNWDDLADQQDAVYEQVTTLAGRRQPVTV